MVNTLKKIIALIGGVGLLAATAGGLRGAQTSSTSLDQVVAQEAVQETAQSAYEQKYAEIKKMFEEANTITISTIKDSGAEYNLPNKSIFSYYVVENNVPYKLNNVTHPSEIRKKNIVVKSNGSPLDIRVACMGVLPNAVIPEDVLAAAKADDVTAPLPDATLPALNLGETYILFLKNIKSVRGIPNSKVVVIGYLPVTDGNKELMESIALKYLK